VGALNAFDVMRVGVASLASVGAALGGFAVSQKDATGLDLAPPLPPVLKDESAKALLARGDTDYAVWGSAFAGEAATTAANFVVEPAKWAFVGVIGDSQSSKAVFSDPSDASHTLMASVGDTLPDGRTVGKISQSHVYFSAPPATAGAQVGATEAPLSLFSGPEAGAPAEASTAPAL